MIFCDAVCACETVSRESNCPFTLLYVVFINAVSDGKTVKRSVKLSADKMYFGFCMQSANCATVRERLPGLLA